MSMKLTYCKKQKTKTKLLQTCESALLRLINDIRSGMERQWIFSSCGIYPYNPHAIYSEDLLTSTMFDKLLHVSNSSAAPVYNDFDSASRTLCWRPRSKF